MPILKTIPSQTLRSLGWLWRRWWGKTLYAMLLIALCIFAYLQLRSDVLVADICAKRGSTAEDPYCAKRMKMVVKRDGAGIKYSYGKEYPIFYWYLKINHPAAANQPFWGSSKIDSHIILWTHARDIEEYYKTYLRILPDDEIVNRMETNEILLVKQGKGNGWQSSLLTVVGNKNKTWIKCAKEYYSVNGTFNDNVGCRVFTILFDNVVLEYPMQRKHLYEWREFNDHVINVIKSKIVNINDFKEL